MTRRQCRSACIPWLKLSGRTFVLDGVSPPQTRTCRPRGVSAVVADEISQVRTYFPSYLCVLQLTRRSVRPARPQKAQNTSESHETGQRTVLTDACVGRTGGEVHAMLRCHWFAFLKQFD